MNEKARAELREALLGMAWEEVWVFRGAMLQLLDAADLMECERDQARADLREANTALRDVTTRWEYMLGVWPTCQHCNHAPASCFGVYEKSTPVEWACDLCCGHGNEDGWCRPLKEACTTMTEIQGDL